MTYVEALEDIIRRSNLLELKIGIQKYNQRRQQGTWEDLDQTDIYYKEPQETRQHTAPSTLKSGTVFSATIPGGTVINLLDLFELSAPDGVSLDIGLPFLRPKSSEDPLSIGVSKIMDWVTQGGITIESVK